MESEEMMAKMIARPSTYRHFDDWPDVLARYANCLKRIESKLDPRDLDALLNVGADFYRTLARAEDYRRSVCGRD
ncbi:MULTISPECIES: hypothetical protein [Achromobacter]|uniref:DNA-3-methyladenine glycosylase n=1 Tax=Achromobacter aegrifaciens TaxID=1287736 RepID=A0AAD2KLW7_ACHAE|nr:MULTISPECIES: hypothetical protein [Achromobacter]CAB3892233.1 hypothetical protein LMG26684_04158 [Achromobacter mucicolens]CUJ71854.1 Uncharacterised protein [Achromobacter aegrifaciens]